MGIVSDGMDVVAEIKSLRKELDVFKNYTVRDIVMDIISLKQYVESLKNENLGLSRKFSLIVQSAEFREYFRINPDKLAKIMETIRDSFGEDK